MSTKKNTDDDNNYCHDNFDQNFGNFYGNSGQIILKNLKILLILGKILPFFTKLKRLLSIDVFPYQVWSHEGYTFKKRPIFGPKFPSWGIGPICTLNQKPFQ